MLNPFVRLIVAAAVLVSVLDARPGTGALIPEPSRRQAVPVQRPDAERRYRIAAKVRVLFFWVGADDVGGARITWRGGEDQCTG